MNAEIRNAVAKVLVNAANFPEEAAPRILGQDMTPLIDKVTAAVLSVLAEQSSSEWEYGVTGFDPERVVGRRDSLGDALQSQRYWRDVIGAPSVVMKRRRREASPWEPIEESTAVTADVLPKAEG